MVQAIRQDQIAEMLNPNKINHINTRKVGVGFPTSTWNNMRYSSNKDFNKRVRNLIKQGWEFQRRRKHCQLVAPNKKSMTFSNSPSDYRAYQNFLNDIKNIQRGYFE
ncbi:hypothetical protein [Psychrobacter piscatorii]|uniref:hypothetical protein n=1 Tax=Psychrobacter piscatorii TaxID=554343 RepID=UPI001917C9EC|nr:hypothetical protein [Psychrobacter piscatorii]